MTVKRESTLELVECECPIKPMDVPKVLIQLPAPAGITRVGLRYLPTGVVISDTLH